MKQVFIGIVHIDQTSTHNFYLETYEKPIDTRDIFGEFEGKKVKVTVQDIEEIETPILTRSVLCSV